MTHDQIAAAHPDALDDRLLALDVGSALPDFPGEATAIRAEQSARAALDRAKQATPEAFAPSLDEREGTLTREVLLDLASRRLGTLAAGEIERVLGLANDPRWDYLDLAAEAARQRSVENTLLYLLFAAAADWRVDHPLPSPR